MFHTLNLFHFLNLNGYQKKQLIPQILPHLFDSSLCLPAYVSLIDRTTETPPPGGGTVLLHPHRLKCTKL